MALQGRLEADFSSFQTACANAEVSLASFQGSAVKVESQLTRVSNSLSGVQIVQQATLAAQAVENLGGVSTLTEQELGKIGATAQAAADKLNALGQEVPAGIQDLADRARGAAEETLRLADAAKAAEDETRRLADAAKNTGDSFSAWSGKFDIEHAISDPLGTAKAGLSAFAETLGPVGIALASVGAAAVAVGAAVYELASSAAETGEGVLNFARIAGTSVEVASQLGNTAIIAGGNLDQMTTIITQLQRRLDATGPTADKLDAALADLNIDAADFRAADPTDRVYMMAAAMQAAEGSTTMVSDALAVMGRGAISNLPVLMKMTQDVQDVARATGYVFTNETAKSAEDLKIKAGELTLAWEALKTSMGTQLEPPVTAAIQATTVLISQTQKEYDLLLKMSGVQIFHPNGPSVVTGPGAPGAGALSPAALPPGMVEGVTQGELDAANAAASLKAFDQAIKDAGTDAAAAAKATQDYWDAIAKVGTKIADLTAGYKDLTPIQEDAIVHLSTLGLSVSDIATRLDLSSTAVQTFETHWKALGNQLDAIQGKAQAFITLPLVQALQSMGEAVPLSKFQDLAIAMGNLPSATNGASAAFSGLATTWNDGSGKLQTFVGGMTLLPGVAAQGTKALNDAAAASQTFGDILGGQLTTQLEKLPGVFASAFGSGGGIGKALSQEAKQLGQIFGKDLTASIQQSIAEGGSGISAGSLTSAAGLGLTSGIAIAAEGDASTTASKIAQVGEQALATSAAVAAAMIATEAATTAEIVGTAAAVGAVTAGVGLAAVGVYLLYEHLKGASDEEKAARQAFSDWSDAASKTFQQIGSAADIAAAGTDKQQQSLLLVHEAYLALGIDGSLAAKDVGIALDSTHNSAANVKTVTDAMTAAIQAYAKLLPQAQQGQKDLGANLQTLTTITPAVAAGLQQVYNAKNIGEYVTAVTKVNALIKQQAADTATLTGAMSKYGITVGELHGKAAEGLEATSAKGLIDDFNALKTAGIDVNDEMRKMGPSINDFVKNAEDAGVQVPAAMQQVIQTAIDAGEIYGKDGKTKITDISQLGLTFGNDMTDGMDDVNKALKKVSGSLQDDLAGGFSAATDAAKLLVDTLEHLPSNIDTTITVNGQSPSLYSPPSQYPYQTGSPDSPQQYATGGIVQYKAGGGLMLPFVARGTDTVPAMLTPGERVLTIAQTKAYDAGDRTPLATETTQPIVVQLVAPDGGVSQEVALDFIVTSATRKTGATVRLARALRNIA